MRSSDVAREVELQRQFREASWIGDSYGMTAAVRGMNSLADRIYGAALHQEREGEDNPEGSGEGGAV